MQPKLIKNYYFFQIGRWDLQLFKETTIKFPYNNIERAIKKSIELTKTISLIPKENLLVETDAPYLSPIPYRGKFNEPSYIIHTIEKLAQIKKTTKEEIISITTKNFKKLFNLS